MSDRIRLEGLRVFAKHGMLAGEAQVGQTFLVDVEVELDLASAAVSDDVADTVDYGKLASRVSELVSIERWNLIETVAERVCGLVLDDGRVECVTVTVHKPSAPIDVPFEDVSVTLTRRRS